MGTSLVKLARVATAITMTAGISTGAVPPSIAASPTAEITLHVLVITDGEPMVEAIRDRLIIEGVPITVIDLNAADRRIITPDYLHTDTSGHFSGVVLPSAAPVALSDDERAALAAYETNFGVREVSAYNWANPTLGMNYASYSGAVDGMTATVTPAGQTNGFSHLTGTVTFDDLDPAVSESYGYLAVPVDNPEPGTIFVPLVTAPIPGANTQGTVLGVHNINGRERLISTVASNKYQTHWKVLSHGIVRWLTRDTSLSFNRNYFSVHIDDVFLPDDRWSVDGNCTIGDGCDVNEYPPTAPGSTIRMTPDDAAYLRQWQYRTGMKMDVVFNGVGVAEFKEENGGVDPLTDEILAHKTDYRYINHTWEHPYLGCIQNYATIPWSCQTTTNGTISYYSQNNIENQINLNTAFATDNGLPLDATELVTGEHSGLKTLPQMVTDNPNLAPALTRTGIRWVASDASREREPRTIGSATTVPRHPMNIFYNVGTKAEEIDEYNWIYTSRSNGGSGVCEDNPQTSTCITPLGPDGFDTYIRPLEARIAYGHMISNDPRPHYAHQGNLAEDRILYPVVDDMLDMYYATFAANAPIVNPAMKEAGQQMADMQSWQINQGSISAKLVGTRLVITNTSASTITVPVTTPAGAHEVSSTGQSAGAFGESYAGQQSGWRDIAPGSTLTIDTGSEIGFKEPAPGAAEEIVDNTLETQPPQDTEVIPLPEADAAILPQETE